MRDSDRTALGDMIHHARLAAQYVQGKTRAEIEADWVATFALVRALEVLGEAATRLSPELRAAHPDIPWSDVVGMRNRLAHGYDVVDLATLWATLTSDLPVLITDLEALLGDEPS